MTNTVIISGDNNPDSSPIAAIIRATSPRDTIAEPIAMALRQLKPAALAPSAEPISFVAMASRLSRIIRPRCEDIPEKSTFTPIVVKKTGTKNA
ncbi:hypothetical protein D3C81_1737990 [compost metagenome]